VRSRLPSAHVQCTPLPHPMAEALQAKLSHGYLVLMVKECRLPARVWGLQTGLQSVSLTTCGRAIGGAQKRRWSTFLSPAGCLRASKSDQRIRQRSNCGNAAPGTGRHRDF
jgi:hypothetical protein